MSGVYADFFERYFPNLREYESNCRPALEAICAAREHLERLNLRSGGLRTFPTKVPSNAVLVNVKYYFTSPSTRTNQALAMLLGGEQIMTYILGDESSILYAARYSCFAGFTDIAAVSLCSISELP